MVSGEVGKLESGKLERGKWSAGSWSMGGGAWGVGARVDPALFAEDEFPVYCPKCDYLLRGLPDGRCPECGTDFDKGRLLVEQYVTRPLGWHRRTNRSRRVLLLGVAAGFALIGINAYVAPLVLQFSLRRVLASASGLRAVSSYIEGMGIGMRVVYGLQALVLAGLLGLVAVNVRAYWRGRVKRRRVAEAIQIAAADTQNA